MSIELAHTEENRAKLIQEVEAELERVRQVKSATAVWDRLGRTPLIDAAIRHADRALEMGHPANLILACNELRSIK